MRSTISCWGKTDEVGRVRVLSLMSVVILVIKGPYIYLVI